MSDWLPPLREPWIIETRRAVLTLLLIRASALEEAQSKLDDQIAALHGLSAELVSRITQLREYRNSMSPIHRLPVEALTEIFTYYLLEYKPRHFPPLCRLARVCRSWATVVHGYARFWAFARREERLEMVERAVARSAGATLEVTWKNNFPEADSQPRRDAGAFWSVLNEHVSRWRWVVIQVRDQKDVKPLLRLGTLESKTAIKLEWLKVHVTDLVRPIVLDLFGGEAPNLKTISLCGVASRSWNSGLFRGLHSLSLAELRVSAPSLKEIMQFIRQSPHLTCLTLERLHVTDHALPLETDAVIHLDKLQTLRLQTMSRPVIAHILSSIRAPLCVHFDCVPDMEALEYPDILTALASCVSPCIERCLKETQGILHNSAGKRG